MLFAGSVSAPNQKPIKSLVKYSYIANPEKPGGFEELTIKQGEHIYFHEAHHLNPHWVKAENQQGEVGYVPATYIMVCTHLILLEISFLVIVIRLF